MQKLGLAATSIVLLAAFTATGLADDQADALAIVHKAIEARGGKALLAKYAASTCQVKGKLQLGDVVLPFTGEWSSQGNTQNRLTLNGDVNGAKFANFRITNGEKGWTKEGNQLKELDKKTVDGDREQLYAEWLTTLVPLLEKQFVLKPLGESKVADRPTVGLKVSSAGHLDVALHIDLERGVVLKRELAIPGAPLEVSYGDFKEVQGLPRYHSISYKLAGKPFMDLALSEIKLHEKLDDSLFVVIGAATADEPTAKTPPSKRTPDVVYGKKSGTALTFDVFRPTEKANGLGVVAVMSGGWFSDHSFVDNPIFRTAMIEPLVKRGYTVFAVMHGSQPKFTIPEAVADVNRAVRFIRAHAADYQIDPERIGITGASAGGHLSLMQGMAGDKGNAQAPDPVDRVSSRVQAVACFYPPTDFLNYGTEGTYAFQAGGILNNLRVAIDVREPDAKTGLLERVSDEKRREIATQVSPITHVTADDPPTLIFHGDKDLLVPIQQAELIVAKLKGLKIPAEVAVKKGAAHGWGDLAKDMETLADWFDKHLAKK